jgi:hypothetical protein
MEKDSFGPRLPPSNGSPMSRPLSVPSPVPAPATPPLAESTPRNVKSMTKSRLDAFDPFEPTADDPFDSFGISFGTSKKVEKVVEDVKEVKRIKMSNNPLTGRQFIPTRARINKSPEKKQELPTPIVKKSDKKGETKGRH